MTQPLNYTTKAIDDLMWFAKQAPPATAQGLSFLSDLLRRAEVFVLPDRGALLDRSKPYPEMPASILKPAFPVVALEYSWANEDSFEPTSLYNCVSCSKRIALAWEWDGRTPGSERITDPAPGTAVVMASISYSDAMKRWSPVSVASMARYDAGYTDRKNPALEEELIRASRTTAKHVAARRLDASDGLVLLPEMLSQVVAKHGSTVAFNAVSADLMDEVNAYRDLCIALACNNVSTARNAAPEKLNKSRIRMGRPPLKDFHVLEIAGHSEGEGWGGGRDGVRSHLRRGHIRRLGPERITWVNATMVRGSRRGFIDKQYAPKGMSR